MFLPVLEVELLNTDVLYALSLVAWPGVWLAQLHLSSVETVAFLTSQCWCNSSCWTYSSSGSSSTFVAAQCIVQQQYNESTYLMCWKTWAGRVTYKMTFSSTWSNKMWVVGMVALHSGILVAWCEGNMVRTWKMTTSLLIDISFWCGTMNCWFGYCWSESLVANWQSIRDLFLPLAWGLNIFATGLGIFMEENLSLMFQRTCMVETQEY